MHQRNAVALVLLLSLGLLPTRINAQQLVGAVYAGYGTFSMHDLKGFQKVMMDRQQFDTRVVETFPGYLSYGVDLLYVRNKGFFGGGWGHTSTGGRLSYSDYSGYYNFDQVVHMNVVSLQGGIRIFPNYETCFFLGLKGAVYSNKLDLKEELSIGNQTVAEVTPMHSTNVACQPFLSAQRTLKRLFLKLDAGYEFHNAGKLTTTDGKNNQIPDGSGKKPATIQPDGLRVSLGVGYVFRSFGH